MAGKVMIPDKTEMLAEAKTYYTTIINAISDIESGMTESAACKKYNLRISSFRQDTLYKRKFTHNIPKPFSPQEVYKPPTWRLYEDILGTKLTTEDLDRLPPDLDETLDKVMLESLSSYQWSAVQAVYFQGLSFTQAGESLGVTSVNVRALTNKALRKLRHPSRAVRIKYGDKYVNELNSRREEFVKALLEKNKPKESDFIEESKPYLDADIEVLKMSVRACNCLRRAGYTSVRAVINAIDGGKLWQVRNLGVRSMNNVIMAVNKYVLECKNNEAQSLNL